MGLSRSIAQTGSILLYREIGMLHTIKDSLSCLKGALMQLTQAKSVPLMKNLTNG